MTFSAGARTQVTIINETVYGVSDFAVAGDSKIVPIINNGLNLKKDIFEDPSISQNTLKKFSRHGNKTVEGDMSVAYAHETYDDFLESLLFSTFAANVLQKGNTLKSQTIEIGHLDIAQHRLFSGVVANSMSLEVNLDGVVQSTFGLIGKDMSVSGTAQDSAPTAAPVKQPMVHFDGTLQEGGVAIAILTGISLNVENSISPDRALGDATIKQLTPGEISVSGELTAYFTNVELLNKFINETSTSIEFELDDGLTNSHTYLLSNVKFNGADIDVSDGNALPLTIPFEALYAVADSGIQITRTV